MLNKPLIQFKKDYVKVEINESIDPASYIEKINGKYQLSDIQIDSSQVDIKKLGQYQIKYTLKDKEYDYFVNGKNNILKEMFLISDAIDMILSNQAVAYQSWIFID